MEDNKNTIKRRKSRQIMVGNVAIGGDAPISVQSMTNTDTKDTKATVEQVNALANAGADIVRVSVPTLDCVDSFEQICKQSLVPIVADIHFDHRIAIAVANRGVSALRINPGNIGSKEKVAMVCQAAIDNNLPIRVGVNAGSLDRDLLNKYKEPCVDAMVEAALRAADILESHNFTNYAFSVKASELNLCVDSYIKLAEVTDAPLHLGVTEAGGLTSGTVLSSIGISWLLKLGIGDTLRVSLAADPIEEVKVGWAILKSMHLRSRGVNVVACPTCARQGIDVVNTVKVLEDRLSDVKESINVAIMGCVVNGPGEALRADVAVCGGTRDNVMIYEDGELQEKVLREKAIDVLEKRIRDKVKIKEMNKDILRLKCQ